MIYKITPPGGLGHIKTVLPASKSISNRVLIINALSGSPRSVGNLAECDDTAVMLEALHNEKNVEKAVDVHGAGTSMRFLTAYFGLSATKRVITGSSRMLQRPISILVEALRSLGAEIDYMGNEGEEGNPFALLDLCHDLLAFSCRGYCLGDCLSSINFRFHRRQRRA